MSTYNLTVELDETWYQQWAQTPEMRLCFAVGVISGDKTYGNVVAHTAAIASKTTVTWVEKYKMAATKSTFGHGVVVTASSVQVDVSPGSTTTLNERWDISTDSSTPEAPKDSFVFTTETASSATLYEEVSGEFVPIYITHVGRMPPHSTETLTPTKRVFVWFSSDAQHASMFDGMQTQRKEVDMTGGLEAAVKYDAEGNWNQLPATVVPATTTMPVAGTK